MKHSFIYPRYMLPLIIFIGVLVMGMSISDIWQAAASGKIFTPIALAETKGDAPPADKTADAAKPTDKPADNGAQPATVSAAASPAAVTPVSVDGKMPAIATPALSDYAKPGEGDNEGSALQRADEGDSSAAEMEVLKQLSDRREQLEKRSRDLDARDNMVKVAEKRVDQKIKELEILRQQLQTMVNQLGDAQAAQTDNLVKIYETMKPEEAARIFETLDMPVLLSVIQKMKPKNTAPILAKMAPEKAKDVTVALTHQDQLPKIK